VHGKYYHDCTAWHRVRGAIPDALWYHCPARATMTTQRAVTYGGLFCLLAAWLASAASTTLQYSQQPVPEGSSGLTTSTEALAAEVQAHAARLRERLASAPVPQLPHRNPFTFESRPAPPPRQIARGIERAVVEEPLPAPEPVLSLIGIAEDNGPTGLTRTAILTDAAESVLFVTVGQTLLGRYTVERVGADTVELKDVESNAIRRLVLR
jgi:hypothetical protein